MTTVELVRSYYDAFNRRDYAAMLAMMTDDVIHDVNQGGREIGTAAFGSFLDRMDRNYRESVTDLVVMAADSGARAAAEFVIDGVYQADDVGLPPARGQHYRLPVGAFFDVRAGKIARVTTYYNLEAWLQMVR